MQINGLGSSQSSDMRYMNNRTQYQNSSDKAADTEEAVKLTLSSMAKEETKKSSVSSQDTQEEVSISDWFQQLIEHIKSFLSKIWNEDPTRKADFAKESSENIAIVESHQEENGQVEESRHLKESLLEESRHLEEGTPVEEHSREEESAGIKETIRQEKSGGLLSPLVEIIKHFLANPFSDEELVSKKQEPLKGKQESAKEQQGRSSFEVYAAANGLNNAEVAHQMQVKSQLWDTYNSKGEHSQLVREVPSNLSIRK